MAKETKAQELARLKAEYEARQPRIGAPDRGYAPLESQRTTLPARMAAALPTGASRDAARMALHGLARTGNTILRAIDIPNRVFGNTRSVLQDIYERSEANLKRDAYEDRSGAPQVGETAVHLASAGILGKALPTVFGANVGADTYETAKYAGASEGEALAKGIGHGAVDTAIWTLGQGLASKYLPKAWQWLGRELNAEPELATISVEDRQPDGTWAFVRALGPNDPSSWRGPFRDTLSPPPTEPPLPEAGPEELNRIQRGLDLDGDWAVQQAAKAGDSPDRFSVSRNFLATDKVPDTIFGIPIVSNEDDYTPEDLAFFREHPEAGGYYDLGEGTPEDGTEEGAPTQDDEPTAFMKRNPTLFSHVKSFEKLRLEPYEDVGGHAIGYGAHADAAGNAVTADTPAIDEATADALLARDLYARREKLARTLPNWNRIPGSARQALLDVSMGKDGILSARKSKGLRADLAAAGEDPAKLLAAVKKHYYSYLSEDPKYRAGLMARRVAGGKTFFGEDFSYEGKTWDPTVGFTATAAPSLPAKKRKASGGSTRSNGVE